MIAVYRALLATLLAGCYSPSYDNCTISCASSGCPDSYQCDSQLHVCRRSGTSCGPADAAADTAGSDSTADGSAATGCMYIQDVASAGGGASLQITFNTPIATGSFVVVTIAQNASAPQTLSSVADQSSTMFSRAVLRTEGDATSAIYYLASAPAPITQVTASWTSSVAEVIDVSEWRCSPTPTFVTSAMGGAQISTTTISAGQVALAGPSLVFGTLMTNTSTLPVIQTQGFTTLHAQAFTATNGIKATIGAVYGFFGVTNNLDVTYSVPQNSLATGTVAAFAATPAM